MPDAIGFSKASLHIVQTSDRSFKLQIDIQLWFLILWYTQTRDLIRTYNLILSCIFTKLHFGFTS
jgi:hypothetical protein